MADLEVVAAPTISRSTIEREWDILSPHRAEQIRQHKDLSFWSLMVPVITELMSGADLRYVLDIGCGTGELTQLMAAKCGRILGIDLSGVAVSYAHSFLMASRNASALHSAVEDLRAVEPNPIFSAAFANMVLMDIVDLGSGLRAISQSMLGRGVFVFSITHPVHWPVYRGYDKAAWYEYDREIIIRAPFKITNQQLGVCSTHVHRPISMYLNAFAEAGFGKVHLFEPVPPKTGDPNYDLAWTSPRYLFGATTREKRPGTELNARSLKKTWNVPGFGRHHFDAGQSGSA